ncbi:DUF7059 domain-containing protein [Schaalia vaccimaxillae]|uniref:DUF7059 domain-containing protein n=1 Tax=Schaalia vaccimaxillae TaxID=183916 RepID=UPI0006891C12|nr:class I SAM-dependent methyltransferase [Schaalia vaccimaxillae]
MIRKFRADVEAAEWTVDGLNAMLSRGASEALMRDQRIPALVELRGREEAAAVLTRFFVLGSNEERAVLDAALPTLGADGAVALGLARPTRTVDDAGALAGAPAGTVTRALTGSGTVTPADTGHIPESETLTALFDVRPHAATLPSPDALDDPEAERDFNWWVVSDLGEAQTGRPLHADHVLGIGGATMSLLGLTIRRRFGSALDLGCGCGIQALYLATHCDRVVATDLSERACDLTRFNAMLNGANIDVRQGSLFEPVSGESFDLIVSNPPFVITPDSVRAEGAAGMFEYRDGGMDRDNLIRTVVRQAPDHLAAGGIVQMLANWEIPAECDPDTQWSGRVQEWLDDLPVDAWIVQRDVLDPARYVDMWIRDSGGQLVDRKVFEETFASWLEDFRKAGVGAIGMGFIALRRLAEDAAKVEPALVFDSELTGQAPRGVDVDQALSTLRLPAELWDLTLERADDVTEERHYVPGTTDPTVMILHQGAGLGRSIAVGTAASAIVGASDGELTVGQITAAVAMLTERDVEDVRREVEEPLRSLIRAGMLRLSRC